MCFDAALKIVLRWEGGYTDHPLDPGGATNLGITRKTLARWRGVKKVSKKDVKDLALKEASSIYRSLYWDAAYCPSLPAKLAICVFDSAVNQGPRTATKLLQKTVRVKQDGFIGPKTLTAISLYPKEPLLFSYMAQRALRYSKLTIFGPFGYGWFRRLFSVYGSASVYRGYNIDNHL